MMQKYIISLFNTNNRIIIPGFGALIKREGLSPEASTVTFSPFLKYNDGLLVSYIAKKEDIPKDEAQKKIETFVDELKDKLNKDKRFPVEGLGEFKVDDKGNVSFAKVGAGAKPVEKKEPAVTKPAAPKPEDKSKTVAAPVKTDPVKKTVAPGADAKKDEKPEPEKKEDVKPKEPVRPKPGASKVTTSPLYSSPGTEKKPFSMSYDADADDYDDTLDLDEGNRRKKILINSAIALVFIIVILVILNQLDVINIFGGKDKVEIEPVAIEQTDSEMSKDDQPTDITSTDASEAKEGKELKMPTDINPKTGELMRYYIIAGSFRIKSNAYRFSRKMKRQGYEGRVILKENNIYSVSMKSYPGYTEAKANLLIFRKRQHDLWLYRY
jgi:nucleoid DNA-binding protein